MEHTDEKKTNAKLFLKLIYSSKNLGKQKRE